MTSNRPYLIRAIYEWIGDNQLTPYLLVDAALPAEDVRKHLQKTARAVVGNAFAVEAVTVFDVYRGKGVPEHQKSIAFSLVFRSGERTLTDEEVNAVFQKIQDELVTATGYTVRK